VRGQIEGHPFGTVAQLQGQSSACQASSRLIEIAIRRAFGRAALAYLEQARQCSRALYGDYVFGTLLHVCPAATSPTFCCRILARFAGTCSHDSIPPQTTAALHYDACYMMQIIVNGEPREVSAGLTAAQLVDLLELGGRRLAMEINREILPRSQFSEHALCAGDRIEIVQAIGGG